LIRLDAGTVLLQWATGMALFGWVTTRRRQVGIGYGWLLRGTVVALAALGVVSGQLLGPVPVRDVCAVLMAVAATVALTVSVVRRKAGVAGERAVKDRRAERVAAMVGRGDGGPTGTGSQAGQGPADQGPADQGPADQGPAEFPPALDLVAPLVGAVGLVAAGVAAGGPHALAVARTLVGAAFLGVVTDAMLLGHWYLVQPKLGRGPLGELNGWLARLWPVWRDPRVVLGGVRRHHSGPHLRHQSRAEGEGLLGGDGRHRAAVPRHPHRLRHRPRGEGHPGGGVTPTPELCTVGHGSRSVAELAAVVRDAGVSLIVDVRRFPGSRRHPHLSRAGLEQGLPSLGIAYRWCEALGGRRSRVAGSRHTAWRNDAFGAYADHMDGLEFRGALDELLGRLPLAVMCAETLWWRCHRRLIADAATLAGVNVVHLLEVGKSQPHPLHPDVRPDEEGRPVYDGGQGRLLEGG